MTMQPSTTFQFNSQLDTEYLDKIYQGDAANAEFIFGMFLAELPGIVSGIRLQLEAADINGLYENIHKNKTSFSLVGLAAVAELMQGGEQLCNTATPFGQLKICIENILAEIERGAPLIKAEHERLAAFSQHAHDTDRLHHI